MNSTIPGSSPQPICAQADLQLFDIAGPDPLHQSQHQFNAFMGCFAPHGEPLVVEVRALAVPNGKYPPKTVTGFFDLSNNSRALWDALKSILAMPPNNQPKGVYVTMNSVVPDLLARANNRLNESSREPISATDANVLKRRRVVIDVDSNRLTGVCATEAERDSAKAVMDEVLADLHGRGWPAPMQVDSGSGFHAWYCIDLPADDGGTIEAFLKALKRKHSRTTANVDTSVFNPSRIIRLPGTWNRKGDSIPTRPHRLVKVLNTPDGPQVVVTREQLEAVIADYQEERKPSSLPLRQLPQNGSSKPMTLEAPNDAVARCRGYLANVPGAVEGDRGSDRTYQAARIVWNDFGLDESDGWQLLCEWNLTCRPPWPEDGVSQCLRRKWNAAVGAGACVKGRGWRLKLHQLATLSADAPDEYPAPQSGESWSDPHRIARLFADQFRNGQDSTLIQWRDEFHQWDGAAWSPKPDTDLDAELARHCRNVFEADLPKRMAEAKAKESKQIPNILAVTAAVKANVRLNLAGLLNHPDSGKVPPFWFGDGGPNPEDVIAAQNGLFTLDGIARGEGAFSCATPRFFTPNAVGFPIDVNPPAPRTWLRCVSEWFGNDAASIAGLQEWFGYALSGRTAAQKILMLVGPRRSGKGTILGVLTHLVGPANIASTTFTALGESFGLENLLGKRIAMISDARLSGRSDTAAIIERLLSVSGEDPQSVNRKNRPRITTRLRARFVVATNELPRLRDASGALESRFHILHTPNTWLGREDHDLHERLTGELPGILKWAAVGWERLNMRHLRFTPNTAADQYHREFEDLSSPMRAFASECCLIGPEHQCDIPDLFTAWVRWNSQRQREVRSECLFGRDMRAAFPHLQCINRRTNLRTRVRAYRGIGLKGEMHWGEDNKK